MGTTPTRAPRNTGSTPRPTAVQADWLARHVGTPVTVRLTDGKALGGTLVAADQFCLALRPAGADEDTLVYKSAVAYIAKKSG